MVAEVITPKGAKKLVRRMFCNCLICGEQLPCPPDADQMAWMKCGDVVDFIRLHRQHGAANTAGVQVEYVEE